MTLKIEVTITHGADGLNTDISCAGSGHRCNCERAQAQFLLHLIREALQLTGSKTVLPLPSQPVSKGDVNVH